MGLIYALTSAISHVQDEQLKRTEKPAPAIPDKLNATEKKLASIFMEHVPTNILDSGSAYGYGYQYYREHPPWLEKPAWVTFDIYEDKNGSVLNITPHISLFHFLAMTLEYNEEWDKKFQDWKASLEWGYSREDLKDFPNPNEHGERFCKDWLGEYTYNNDTALSRDMDYEKSMYKGYEVAIVSIHNGCDARCGFTKPVLFKSSEYFWGHPSMAISCPRCGVYWDFEDLTNCDVSLEGDDSLEAKLLEEYPFEKGDKGKAGVLVIKDETTAFCPVCGKSILEPWFEI